MRIIYEEIIENSLPQRALRTLRFYFYEIKNSEAVFLRALCALCGKNQICKANKKVSIKNTKTIQNKWKNLKLHFS